VSQRSTKKWQMAPEAKKTAEGNVWSTVFGSRDVNLEYRDLETGS